MGGGGGGRGGGGGGGGGGAEFLMGYWVPFFITTEKVAESSCGTLGGEKKELRSVSEICAFGNDPV